MTPTSLVTLAILALLLVALRAVLNSRRFQRKLPPDKDRRVFPSWEIFFKSPESAHITSSSSTPYLPSRPSSQFHIYNNRFTKWSKAHGGLYTLRIGPSTAAVLTDRRLVKDLLDKRSALYSSRPTSRVGQTLITRGDHMLVMNNTETWRLFRKAVNQHFSAAMCESEHVISLLEAEHTQMMRDFLVRPKLHMVHTKRTINSIIMSLLFGMRTPSSETRHMRELYRIMDMWSRIMETGNTPPVDIFPWLKYIPQRWLGNWIDRSNAVGLAMKRLYSSFHQQAIEARRKNTSTSRVSAAPPTFLSHVLDLQDKTGLTDNQVDFLGGVMMEGGSDTGSTMLLVMIQALALHPEVQERAHAEIDAVCGDDRSPTWADFPRLPYVNMIVKETMRWRPVTPLAFPHALNKDDWVGEYFLPKGTTIFLNVWGLHHDETIHADPDKFDPSRFEGREHKLAPEWAASPEYMQRDHYIYGAGRRICPGIHLSERSMFVGAAKLLWGFRFAQDRDEKGGLVPIDTDPVTGYTEGFLVCPRPFRCAVTARSRGHEETIRSEFGRAEREVFSRYAVPEA